MSGMTSIMAGMAFVKITMDNAELKRGVQEAQGQIKRLADSAQAFSNKMLLIGAIAVPPIVMATKAFAAFDDQMRLTAAVFRRHRGTVRRHDRAGQEARPRNEI